MTEIDGRVTWVIKTTAKPGKVYFNRVGDPASLDGLGTGLWCGTPPIAKFIARWANQVTGWWAW